jgi:hypothetical protein
MAYLPIASFAVSVLALIGVYYAIQSAHYAKKQGQHWGNLRGRSWLTTEVCGTSARKRHAPVTAPIYREVLC